MQGGGHGSNRLLAGGPGSLQGVRVPIIFSAWSPEVEPEILDAAQRF